ncbi:unnamed protein product [Clavelina lepadiformis]|uniref:Uncharacterized protein n=1 Tax=Clavelina lepadiformis TaxID=159417 RepID=A0ABP0FC28_CLALP
MDDWSRVKRQRSFLTKKVEDVYGKCTSSKAVHRQRSRQKCCQCPNEVEAGSTAPWSPIFLEIN